MLHERRTNATSTKTKKNTYVVQLQMLFHLVVLGTSYSFAPPYMRDDNLPSLPHKFMLGVDERS